MFTLLYMFAANNRAFLLHNARLSLLSAEGGCNAALAIETGWGDNSCNVDILVAILKNSEGKGKIGKFDWLKTFRSPQQPYKTTGELIHRE